MIEAQTNVPLICCQALGKSYRVGDGVIQALCEVSLTVMRGEFVAVMGPSGSGKSTLMNVVGCLDPASTGRYELAGEPIDTLSGDDLAAVRNRRIGFVFQQFNLLPRTSALENVALPLLYAGVPRRLRRARALQGLRDVGLADRAEHWPSQLSGGQQQRVALARALVNDPDLILADEPTGALDTRTSLEVMVVLQSLNRRGITLLVVTHEPEIAAFAGRRIDFRDGRLVSDLRQVPHDAARALAKLEGAAVGTELV